MSKSSPSRTPSKRDDARIYLDAAERIFAAWDTEPGYNMPGKQFGDWWIDLFHSGELLSESRVDHVVLSLCFMAAITERP